MNLYIQQIRRLSWMLLSSLILNACLVAWMLFSFLTDMSTPTAHQNFYQSPKALQEAKPLATNAELNAAIGALKGLTIDELLSQLPDRRVVENGFTVGDLALSSLVGFYYFDIERALGRPLEKAVVAYGQKGETLIVYPGLSDDDFIALDKFIRLEKWPYRAQGLFRLLKNDKYKQDSSLQEAFFLTPEYRAVELILSRAPAKIEKSETLELTLSQEWGRIAAFYEKQKAALDLSDGARRLFLLNAIEEQSSPSAARILLKSDWDFSLKKLEDKTTVKILSLLKDNKELAERFASELIKTPRSEMVKRSAAAYVAAPVTLPAPSTIASAIKAVGMTPPLKPTLKKASITPSSPSSVKERIYIVQKNETLSTIAKRFNLNLETLRKMNGLNSDELKPGRPLRLPSS